MQEKIKSIPYIDRMKNEYKRKTDNLFPVENSEITFEGKI
jgi:hypothetical protein